MSTDAIEANSRKIYVVFQGGGARGAVHAGALKALELAKFPPEDASKPAIEPQIVGVAGTSAGSIIASLVSAGYVADQILDINGGTGRHILQGLQSFSSGSLTGLFTSEGWARISRIKWATKKYRSLRWLAMCVLFSMALVPPVAVMLFYMEFKAIGFWLLLSFIAVTIIFEIIVILKVRNVFSEGLAPLNKVREVIDEVLANSPLGEHLPVKRDITFEHLEKAGGKPLRIVATNLSKKKLQLFSVDVTPHVPIADAICASICLPFIFKPYEVKMPDGDVDRFADGGVLSNLPLWAFDDERIFQPDCWTIGISLRSADVAGGSPGHWLGAIIDAIVSGPPEIHARNIPGLVIVPAKTKLHLLDFDKSYQEYVEEAGKVVNEASAELVKAVAAPMIELVLQRIAGSLEDTFGDALSQPIESRSFTLKLAIATRRGDDRRRLWPRFEAGYDFEEAVERRRPISQGAQKYCKVYVRETPRLGADVSDDLFIDGSAWAVNSSLWCIAMPLIPLHDTSFADPPILLVESSTLTLDQICDIYEEDNLRNAFRSAIQSISAIVSAADGDSNLIERVQGAQLWK